MIISSSLPITNRLSLDAAFSFGSFHFIFGSGLPVTGHLMVTEAPLSTIIPPPTVIVTSGFVKKVMLLFAVLITGGSENGEGKYEKCISHTDEWSMGMVNVPNGKLIAICSMIVNLRRFGSFPFSIMSFYNCFTQNSGLHIIPRITSQLYH